MSKFGGVFLLLLLLAVVNAAVANDGRNKSAGTSYRVAANERLTAVNGALLFVLFVAIAITVLFIRPLLVAHYLVGFALIPPLALKLYSTGYRFVRYYTRDREFVLAGPPAPLLRFADAPVLVASTVAVMASGVELWAFADRFGTWWLSVHTASAVVFMAALFVHVLSHLRRSADAVAEDAAGRRAEGSRVRRSLLFGCAILAIVLALASMSYVSPFGSSGFGG